MDLKSQVFNRMKDDWQNIFYQVQNFKIQGQQANGRCPFHNDTNNSFSLNIENLQYNCFACPDIKGDVWHYLQKTENLSFKEALNKYALKYNIQKPKKQKTLNPQLIKSYVDNLLKLKSIRTYLNDERGFTDETIERFKIGWESEKRKMYSIPLKNKHGKFINIKYHNSKLDPKAKYEVTGLGVVLFNSNIIKDNNNPIIICEGEFDCMLLEQFGFDAVSSTSGCTTFLKVWGPLFEDKDVILIYDNDEIGQKAVKTKVIPVLKKHVKSLKNVRLPLPGTKDQKDVTDYFVKTGGSVEGLQSLIDETDFINIKNEKINDEVIDIKSFINIEKNEFIDKKITCLINVCGETSQAFHAPVTFQVTYCKKIEDINHGCTGCTINTDINLSPSSNEFIGACGSSDSQVIGMLRNLCCPFNLKPSIEITKKRTVKEFFCSSVNDTGETVEKKVYLLSSSTVSPGLYQTEGWVKTHPRTQQITYLIESFVAQDDDYKNFVLAENEALLRSLQKIGYETMIEDLVNHVTNIYEVDELILAMLLTYCSPIHLSFNNENIRGWLNIAIVGDSGTGKSQTYKRLFDYIGIGDVFQATTSSRTGFVYGMQCKANGEWQIRIGKHPANNNKLLVVDEVGVIEAEDFRTVSIGMDEGVIKIDKVVSRQYQSKTRLILIGNPKNDKIMDSFNFGCYSLRTLFTPPFIRRLDLGIFLNRNHVSNKNLINKIHVASEKPQITPKMIKALIHWAWNLKSEQIIFTKEAIEECLLKATELHSKFGYGQEIPLVEASDFRKTLARLAASFAVMSLSTQDLKTITVEREHILQIVNLLDTVYTSDSCQLHVYSDIKKKETEIEDYDELEKEFLFKAKEIREAQDDFSIQMESQERNNFVSIVIQLLSNTNINRVDLINFSNTSSSTLDRIIKYLKDKNLIKSNRQGYHVTARFNKFLGRFSKKHKIFHI